MSVKTNPQTTAQSHQTPPELRNWARNQIQVTRIERFRDENENQRRGWNVEATSVNVSKLPSGFGVAYVSTNLDGNVTVQVVEE